MSQSSSRRRGNVQTRAAQYFGMEGDSPTSLKSGRSRVLLVCKRGGGLVVAIYSEEGREPRGEYFYTDDAGHPQQIVDAITGWDSLLLSRECESE